MHRALCVVAVACALAAGPVALAQQSVPAVGKLASPTGEAGGPASPVARPQTAWPRILLQSKPGEVPVPEDAWTVEEIDQARARCGELLKGLDIAVVALAPMREGECGAPAPVQLISVGSNPPVSFSPPPTLNCDMVAALHRWLEREVQPLARRHLGA